MYLFLFIWKKPKRALHKGNIPSKSTGIDVFILLLIMIIIRPFSCIVQSRRAYLLFLTFRSQVFLVATKNVWVMSETILGHNRKCSLQGFTTSFQYSLKVTSLGRLDKLRLMESSFVLLFVYNLLYKQCVNGLKTKCVYNGNGWDSRECKYRTVWQGRMPIITSEPPVEITIFQAPSARSCSANNLALPPRFSVLINGGPAKRWWQ